jgi:hypothetical protein
MSRVAWPLVLVLVGCGSPAGSGDGRIVDSREGFGAYCRIAADGDTVVVAYVGPVADGVFLARSTDGGATFGRNAIAVDPAGNFTTAVSVAGRRIYVAYGGKDTDVRLARSDDGGDTFSVQIIASKALGPAMLVSGDTIHLAFETFPSSTARLYHQSSADGGVTWSSPAPISGGAVDIHTVSFGSTPSALQASFFDAVTSLQTTAHSPDGGETWVEEPGQLGLLATGPMVVVADGIAVPVARLDNVLFVTGSADSGATWTNSPFDPPGGAFGDNPLDDVSVDNTTAGMRLAVRETTMFAIFPQGTVGVWPTRLGFARSTDRGVTWPAADVGTAFTSDPKAVTDFYLTEHADITVASGSAPAILVAFFDGSHLRVLRSTDDGTTWQ